MSLLITGTKVKHVSFGGTLVKGFKGKLDKTHLHQETITDVKGVRRQVWKKDDEFFEAEFPGGYNADLVYNFGSDMKHQDTSDIPKLRELRKHGLRMHTIAKEKQ